MVWVLKKTLVAAVALWLLAGLTAGFQTASQPERQGLSFDVTLAPGVAAGPVSGRLLVLMTSDPNALDVIRFGFAGLFGPPAYVAAEEVTLRPGQALRFDPDRNAFPAPLSAAPAGDYQVMALLDVDHSYAYAQMGPGDVHSAVAALPRAGGLRRISLALSKIVQDDPPAEKETIRLVSLQSPALSEYWGRPIAIRAAVLLPDSYTKSPRRTFPAVFHIHGFGGDHREAWTYGARIADWMRDGTIPEMVHVYLDASWPLGHHEFADSVNNGPWGRALVDEFIPHLEKKFRLGGKPADRFLTGHSSGGWSSLWLQVRHPDFFGGTWSTAPDPVDFRSFTGVNLQADPPENMYRRPGGRARNLIRLEGKDRMTIEEFSRLERVLGEYGGQMDSFDAVFSPRGTDGRPQPLYHRETGEINPAVAAAWKRYDIRRILEENWKDLGPRLRSKIRIFVGDEDNFHLEEAVFHLRDFFKRVGSDALVEIVPGRDHFTLLDDALQKRIFRQMRGTGSRLQAPGVRIRKLIANDNSSYRQVSPAIP